MFKSFKVFAGEVYYDLPETMRRAYGSEGKHFKSYLENNGFEPWLESLRDSTINLNEAFSVVATYLSAGKRSYEDLPHVFNSLVNHYGMTFPAEEGIMTSEYWENKRYYDSNDSEFSL